jgi:hypothetical protein
MPGSVAALAVTDETYALLIPLVAPSIRYRFPRGIFEIDEQLLIPEWTLIHGASDPNDMANPTKSPKWHEQTLFLATRGATDWLTTYCYADDMVRVALVCSRDLEAWRTREKN